MIREAASGRPQIRGLLPALLCALLALSPSLAAEPAASSGRLSSRLPAAVADAQRLVEKLRGVPFGGTVSSAVLSEKELPRILERRLGEDLPVPFERYTASLVALGLVAPEPDLKRRMLQLYSRQVAGFYDPDEKKFFVIPERTDEAVRAASGLGASAEGLLEDALLTHELTHALQDRRLDLVPRMKRLRENSDAALALQAFLEGEATVVMMEAILARLPAEARALTSADQLLASMAQLAAGGLEGAEGVPEYFVKELLFPYTSGTAWVASRRARGGWSAIDAAYDQVPATTAEILDPGRDARGRSLLPFGALPSSEDLPRRARVLYADRLGAFTLRSLLEAAGASEAGPLAAAWEDDRILFYEMPGRTASSVGFAWRIRLASAVRARALASVLGPFYEAVAPGAAVVRADGDLVRVDRRPAPLSPRGGASALPAGTRRAEPR